MKAHKAWVYLRPIFPESTKFVDFDCGLKKTDAQSCLVTALGVGVHSRRSFRPDTVVVAGVPALANNTLALNDVDITIDG
jgi:hypothetical protein